MLSTKVTIIVPTHNRPDYLFRALLSVKLQTFRDFSCIIFGDNCVSSEKVYRDFLINDSRFVYFKMIGNKITNTGAVGRRVAMDYCESKYIAYCDDDNVLLPNHIEVLYQAACSQGVSVICSNMNHIEYNEMPVFDVLNRDLYFVDPTLKVTVQNFDTTATMHTLKSSVDVGGWVPYNDIYGQYNEDGNFIRKLRAEHRFMYLDDITSIYTCRDKGVDGGYKAAVLGLGSDQIYVYPSIVDSLKAKYLK